MDMIELDGAQGEGGGQILRTALTLAMITGTPFHIGNIRAGRRKPGLLRQHLTAVHAAAAICDARVTGAEPGSRQLAFTPGPLRAGDYRFAIGTAGSCTLVLQTVLPALGYADGESTLAVSGGTHNPAAPPADFLIQAWQPLMHRLGADLDIRLVRHGFYPAGGGEITARTGPSRLQPLILEERGALREIRAEAVVAGVPGGVARRELEQFARHFPDSRGEINLRLRAEGPGNAFLVTVRHEEISEVFCGLGERGLPAEQVAAEVARRVAAYLDSSAAMDEHLADQLALPLALAGGGRFTTRTCSTHLRTNLAVIEKFLPVESHIEAVGDAWRVVLG